MPSSWESVYLISQTPIFSRSSKLGLSAASFPLRPDDESDAIGSLGKRRFEYSLSDSAVSSSVRVRNFSLLHGDLAVICKGRVLVNSEDHTTRRSGSTAARRSEFSPSCCQPTRHIRFETSKSLAGDALQGFVDFSLGLPKPFQVTREARLRIRHSADLSKTRCKFQKCAECRKTRANGEQNSVGAVRASSSPFSVVLTSC